MDFKICMMAAVAVFAFGVTESKPVAELQHLPPRPGYVPVYIRLGDTPLYEINAELAEAFREQRGVRPEDAGRALTLADEGTELPHGDQPKDKEEKPQESVAAKQKELSLDDLDDIVLAEGDKEEKISGETNIKTDSLDKIDDLLPLSLDNVDTSDSPQESESSSKSQENSVHIQKIPKTKKHQS